MISVTEARNIIRENIPNILPVQAKLENCAGRMLAKDVIAPIDIPAYPQSSMDGYAFSFAEWKDQPVLKIIGEMAAGDQTQFTIASASAVRIFTGAAVPNGADTVVMQEKVRINNGILEILDDQLIAGANVRKTGAEIKAGEMALSAGAMLTPAAIGFLAGLGITTVSVVPLPKVTVIITGNELQQPGESLVYGKVYDANSYSLSAALQASGIKEIQIRRAPDKLELLTEQLALALAESDIVLLTGGVSVGDYDFVIEATQRCGVTTRFHKLKQKPGKPLFFGTKDRQLIFGLPGNPSSVLTCFYMYVVPVIAKWVSGKQGLSEQKAALAGTYQKSAGLTHFLKGFFDGGKVSISGAQESFRMRSFATANCLVEIGEDVTVVEEGTIVPIHLLPI